jgi:hypothetical protein
MRKMDSPRLRKILESFKKYELELEIDDITGEISIEKLDGIAKRVADIKGESTRGFGGGSLSIFRDFFPRQQHNEHLLGDLVTYLAKGVKAIPEGHNRTLSRYIATLFEAYGFFDTDKDFHTLFVDPFGYHGGNIVTELLTTADPDASLDITMGPKNIAFYLRNAKLVTGCANALLEVDESLREEASKAIGNVAYELRNTDPKVAKFEMESVLAVISDSDSKDLPGLIKCYNQPKLGGKSLLSTWISGRGAIE